MYQLSDAVMIEIGLPLVEIMLAKGTPDANYWRNVRTSYIQDMVVRGEDRIEAERRSERMMALVAYGRRYRNEI